MKTFFFVYILPFIISVGCVFCLSKNAQFNAYLFKEHTGSSINLKTRYLVNFSSNNAYEDVFLTGNDTAGTIFILGSSELTVESDVLPFNFFSSRFKTQVYGVGHAGNQCFSIFSQLLANQNKLHNTPIVIVLSPGWFASTSSRGTTSPLFLEFNSENFLNRIVSATPQKSHHAYAYKRVAQLYNEFNSPNLGLKLMNFNYQASRSIIHKTIYTPLLAFDKWLLKQKEQTASLHFSEDAVVDHAPIIPEQVSINWDSLLVDSKKEVLKKVTNNTLGIADDYYLQYINGKTGHIDAVPPRFNQELEDCYELIALLRSTNAKASFIISPLNTLYYKNIKDIIPTIDLIENKLKENNFPYLNLLTADSARYEKAILHDVMHMSDYGWYQVNYFITNTYQLIK